MTVLQTLEEQQWLMLVKSKSTSNLHLVRSNLLKYRTTLKKKNKKTRVNICNSGCTLYLKVFFVQVFSYLFIGTGSCGSTVSSLLSTSLSLCCVWRTTPRDWSTERMKRSVAITWMCNDKLLRRRWCCCDCDNQLSSIAISPLTLANLICCCVVVTRCR